MACYICGSVKNKVRPGSVRGEMEIGILECLKCGLVYLSSHSHIERCVRKYRSHSPAPSAAAPPAEHAGLLSAARSDP